MRRRSASRNECATRGDETKACGPLNPEIDPPAGAVATEAAFPIVGLGASAGGLAALEGFFTALPTDRTIGMAFVVVQHLAPDHNSILTDLLQRCTRLRVVEAANAMVVQPDCVYIIPPNRDLALLHGRLQLLEPATPRLRRLPIDFFFKSLAQDQRDRAIGIVLSGTGSDGTLGARAIKGEGGMVMAQDPASAEYDGMPRSVIGTGLVDFVLPPAEMPQRLLAYGAQAFAKRTSAVAEEAPPDELAMATIFVLLRAQTGHDFSQYKRNTIYRRIQRRMAVHRIDAIDGYVRLLQEAPNEVVDLFREMLIRVTSFFRDPAVFDCLKAEIAKRVLETKSDGRELRVWVPACCTGEEAYSIAILLRELIEESGREIDVHIFATDIDGAAIAQARSGVYPPGIAAEMTPERLARAFDTEPDTGRFRVKKALRDMLIFSEQDVIRDPPFSRIDLISCRNLMIYMGADLQAKLLGVFHYALNPGGLLLLGTSETVGDHRSLFACLDATAKLYQRQADTPSDAGPGVARSFASLTAAAGALRPFQQRLRGRRPPLRDLTERGMLQHCAAVGLLITERGDILYLHGRTGGYLEPAPGESSLNVLAMAREGLRPALTMALREAVATKKSVRRSGLRVQANGSLHAVDLTIRHVVADRSAVAEPDLYLVILEAPKRLDPVDPPATDEAGPAARDADPTSESEARIANLKAQLQEQADYLQVSRHDLEVTNEELKSTNDAFQSLNEELQSTNEEMETSKEELQSVNEELATVNAELQQRVAELTRANNDLNNLMAGTGVGTIFVDHDMRIQRFTPESVTIINLIAADVGRPLGQITGNLIGYDGLLADIQAVLDSLIPREVEVRTATAWYLLRIRPYRTLKNVIEGAVITFTDITELKKGQDGLRRLAAVIRDSRDAMVVQDLAGQIIAWNPGAERLYGWSEQEALAMNFRQIVPDALREGDGAALRRMCRSGSMKPIRSQRVAKDGRVVEVDLTASALTDAADGMYGICTTEREYHE